MTENEQVTRENEQLVTEKQRLTTGKEQLQQELWAANTRRDESQEQVQQLRQQVSDIILTLSDGYSCSYSISCQP